MRKGIFRKIIQNSGDCGAVTSKKAVYVAIKKPYRKKTGKTPAIATAEFERSKRLSATTDVGRYIPAKNLVYKIYITWSQRCAPLEGARPFRVGVYRADSKRGGKGRRRAAILFSFVCFYPQRAVLDKGRLRGKEKLWILYCSLKS